MRKRLVERVDHNEQRGVAVDGLGQCLDELGHGFKRMEEDGFHTVIARSTIEFVREIKPGDLFVIDSGFIKCGNKSCTHLQRLINADTGVLHAFQETVEVFFDAKTRGSIAIPDEIRALVEANMVEREDIDRARGAGG